MRDRLLLSRDLLSPTGSIFVQISDENVHHVREVMDEVFGEENFCSLIQFSKTSGLGSARLSTVADYLLWYARDVKSVKFRQLYLGKEPGAAGGSQYTWVQLPDGSRRNMGSVDELRSLPEGSRIFVHGAITSQRPRNENDLAEFEFEGRTFQPGKGVFKTDRDGLQRLAAAHRLM